MFSMPDRYPSVDGAFVCPFGTRFGGTYFGDWNSHEGNECLWSWDRSTQYYRQSDALLLRKHVESRVYTSLRHRVRCRFGDGPGTDAVSGLRGNDFRRDCAIRSVVTRSSYRTRWYFSPNWRNTQRSIRTETDRAHWNDRGSGRRRAFYDKDTVVPLGYPLL